MIGPPGAGKTMLAQRLATILPPLSLAESLETTRIYSSMGLMPKNKALMAIRPFNEKCVRTTISYFLNYT